MSKKKWPSWFMADHLVGELEWESGDGFVWFPNRTNYQMHLRNHIDWHLIYKGGRTRILRQPTIMHFDGEMSTLTIFYGGE